MKKTFWFWLYFIVSIILGVYFATRIIMVILGRGSNTTVKHVYISADVEDTDLTAIKNALGITPGTRAYGLDLEHLNARILSVPGVRDSATRRLPNGTIVIRVKLYRPVALWTDGEMYYPLSADGTIVKRPHPQRDAGAVLFRGKLPDDLTEITQVVHNLITDLDYLEWIENRRWDIYTTGGIQVMLPENHPTDAIATLIMLNKDHQIFARDIRVIDMRNDDRILVK